MSLTQLAEKDNPALTPEQIAEREKEERRMSQKPFYPDDWEGSFGVPVSDHQNVVIETIDEYGSYDSDPKKQRK